MNLDTCSRMACTLLMAFIPANVLQSAATAASPLFAYVGTLSSAPLTDGKSPANHGRGIHVFEVSRETGMLTPRGVVEQAASPTSIVVDSQRGRLYATNETDRVNSSGEGTISAYQLEAKSGMPTLINTIRSGGAGPAHISLHPHGNSLLVANYGGGSIAVLPIAADGSLGEPVDVKNVRGEIGPTHATNAPSGSFAFSGHDRSHAHAIQADVTGKHILHTDLGLDRIFIWRIDNKSGRLAPANPPSTSLPAGDGPRHICFHPNGKTLYSIQEEASTITRFAYDAGSGKLEPQQTISTLPEGFAGSNFASTVAVSSNGKFLYAGNRLHDSIAVFSIDETGKLKLEHVIWSRGSYPSNFSLDPSGQFLYCSNQNSDNVTSFRISPDDGNLEFIGQFTPVGHPMSIAFWEPAGS